MKVIKKEKMSIISNTIVPKNQPQPLYAILSIPQTESITMSAETHSNMPFRINLILFMIS